MWTLEAPVYMKEVLAFMMDHKPERNHNPDARTEAATHPDTRKIAITIGENMDRHVHDGTGVIRLFSTDLSNRYHAQFVCDQPRAAQAFFGLIDPDQIRMYQDVEIVAMRFNNRRGKPAVLAIEYQGGGVVEVYDSPLDCDLLPFIERTMNDVPLSHVPAGSMCAYHLRDAMGFVQIATHDSNSVQFCTMLDGCHFFQTIARSEFGLSIIQSYVHP